MNRAEKRRQQKLAEKAAKKAKRPPSSSSPFPERPAGIIDQSLSLALQHLIGGRSAQAERLYTKILEAEPKQPVALHFLGVIARQRGNNFLSVDLISKALAIDPDYAEAHNNLGTAFKHLGRLAEAVASHDKAISINPDNASAHFNHGNVFYQLGRLNEAVTSYHKALAIKPEYVEAHCNLGITLQNQENYDLAAASYQKALAIKPDFAKAHYNLGTLLQHRGQFNDAIARYDLSGLEISRIKSLECLYALEMYDEFYLSIDKLIKAGTKSPYVAAISAFASQQLNRADSYPFCKNPMDFVRMYEKPVGLDDDDGFLRRLGDELKSRAIDWEPTGKTTHNGFQSPSNLFINPMGLLAELETIIKENIENYRSEFSSESFDFIKFMPRKLALEGWAVRFLQGGHQTGHIHPGGWLSGVFYLQVPKICDQDEGSIEFGLWGYNYPILDNNFPRKRYYPKNGNLVLFPSSLFHRTIPFHSDEERTCVAFDLMPAKFAMADFANV